MVFGKMFGKKKSPEEKLRRAMELKAAGDTRYADKLKDAAASGSPEANFLLGKAIDKGEISGNKAQAKKYIEEAVRLNCPGAKTYLGYSYISGQFGDNNIHKAHDLLQEAHQEGDNVATNNLGFIHAKGLLGRSDPKEALKYYEMSAEKGDAYAPFNIGVMYLKGEGLAVNLNRSLEWFQKAANLGNPRAPELVVVVKEQIKLHHEEATIAGAIGRSFVSSLPNKGSAQQALEQLEEILTNERVKVSVG